MGGREHWSNCNMINSHLWILICVFLHNKPSVSQASKEDLGEEQRRLKLVDGVEGVVDHELLAPVAEGEQVVEHGLDAGAGESGGHEPGDQVHPVADGGRQREGLLALEVCGWRDLLDGEVG